VIRQLRDLVIWVEGGEVVLGIFCSAGFNPYPLVVEEVAMINTARLIVRRFYEGDYVALYAYLSNPSVYRFEPGEPISLEKAKQLCIERAQGDDYWAVILRSTSEMVGHLSFRQTGTQEFFTWELGYIFNPEFHNQGYATEAAKALLAYGFKNFGIHRVVAHCSPENIASWRVLEKIGMRREGHYHKNIFFYRDEQGKPLWIDTYSYAILGEDVF
jgi:RimJ/RimL family protein N-acetyltransferase